MTEAVGLLDVVFGIEDCLSTSPHAVAAAAESSVLVAHRCAQQIHARIFCAVNLTSLRYYQSSSCYMFIEEG